MCNQKRGTSIIDKCLINEINKINLIKGTKTILSCCGHGKYQPTIIIKNTFMNYVFEQYSCVILNNRYKNGKIRHRFYKKDAEGFYFIPELMNDPDYKIMK